MALISLLDLTIVQCIWIGGHGGAFSQQGRGKIAHPKLNQTSAKHWQVKAKCSRSSSPSSLLSPFPWTPGQPREYRRGKAHLPSREMLNAEKILQLWIFCGNWFGRNPTRSQRTWCKAFEYDHWPVWITQGSIIDREVEKVSHIAA